MGEAIKLLTQVIERNPENYLAYLQRSHAKYNLKDYKGALEDSKAILAETFTPDRHSLFLAYKNIGISCGNLERYDEAIAFLRKAKKINSSDATTYYSLAYVYLQQQHLDSAYTEFENLLKIDSLDQRG